MSNRTDHELPAEVTDALGRLGQALVTGEVSVALVTDALSHLSSLPPQAVRLADATVANVAQLHRRHEPRLSLLSLLRPRYTAFDPLDRCPELSLVFLFHRDGYVREAALDSLVAPPTSPFFLAAITWRLNDWVRPVRIAARRCAERLLPDTPAEVIARTAPFLLDRWRRWRRWEEDNASVVHRALQREDVAPYLAEWFNGGVTGSLATLLRYALRGPSLDGYLLRLSREAIQPAVRAIAIRALIEGRASWPIGFGREWIDKRYGLWKRIPLLAHRAIAHGHAPELLIREGLRDRSAVVRRVAADALIERRKSFPDLDAIVATMAADRSPGIRERADFIVRNPSQDDVQGKLAERPSRPIQSD
jgi:hypothetical protein